jgi:hypothetical protein
VVVVAGIFRGSGILNVEMGVDVFEQIRLHAQDGAGILIKMGIGIGPDHERRRAKRREYGEGKKDTVFHGT